MNDALDLIKNILVCCCLCATLCATCRNEQVNDQITKQVTILQNVCNDVQECVYRTDEQTETTNDGGATLYE